MVNSSCRLRWVLIVAEQSPWLVTSCEQHDYAVVAFRGAEAHLVRVDPDTQVLREVDHTGSATIIVVKWTDLESGILPLGIEDPK